jgi:hypothetical protein
MEIFPHQHVDFCLAPVWKCAEIAEIEWRWSTIVHISFWISLRLVVKLRDDLSFTTLCLRLNSPNVTVR